MKIELKLTVEANNGSPAQLSDNIRTALHTLDYSLTNWGSPNNVEGVAIKMDAAGECERTIEDGGGGCWEATAKITR